MPRSPHLPRAHATTRRPCSRVEAKRVQPTSEPASRDSRRNVDPPLSRGRHKPRLARAMELAPIVAVSYGGLLLGTAANMLVRSDDSARIVGCCLTLGGLGVAWG